MIVAIVMAGHLIALVLAGGAADPPMCPGMTVPLVSPNGRWAVECRPKPESRQPHHLVIKDVRSGNTRLLRSFDRHTAIFWSPSGDRLAITDFEGSNVAESFVYMPGPPIVVQNVFDLLHQQVPVADLAFPKRKDHVYLEVSRWTDAIHLMVRLWGYGDGSEFDRKFTILVPRQSKNRRAK